MNHYGVDAQFGNGVVKRGGRPAEQTATVGEKVADTYAGKESED